MCKKMSVPYGGHLPMNRELLIACESGCSLKSINSKSPALIQLNTFIDTILLTHLKHLKRLSNDQEKNTDSDLTNGSVATTTTVASVGLIQVP